MPSNVDPGLVDYLRKQHDAGLTVAQIREDLKNTTWTQADLDNALLTVGADMRPPKVDANKPTWGKVALGSFSSPDQLAFMHAVYGWMCLGLVITAVVSYVVASIPSFIALIIGNEFIFYGLLIAELLAVIFLATRIHKMSATTAAIVFLLYAALNGLTFSVIFLVYQISSIGSVFVITAGLFGAMSLYGYFTKRDLTTLGSFAVMALFGLVFAMVVNFFFQSDMLSFILACIGVLIFVVLTAYDTQKLKWLYEVGLTEGPDGERKEAINGALTLYLDFINLFLDLLRIMGRRR
jgi:FtsH-binding integral membrane protein